MAGTLEENEMVQVKLFTRMAKVKKLDGGDPQAVSVLEAAARLRIGRTAMRKLLRNGDVRSFKLGRLRRVSVKSIEDFVRKAARRRSKVAVTLREQARGKR
jgi:excisionase family DNA binding protein